MFRLFHLFNHRAIYRSLTSISHELLIPSSFERCILSPKYTSQKCSHIYSQHTFFNMCTSSNNDKLFTVKTPSFADSITEGDIKWRCNVGDIISEDEILAEIETDKTSLPIHSPHAGIVEIFLVSDGEKVIEGQELLRIRHNNISQSIINAATPPPSVKTVTSDLESMVMQDKSFEKDVSDNNSQDPHVLQNTPIDTISPSVHSVKDKSPLGEIYSGSRMERRVKMSRMRLRISERLKASQNTAAMLTTFNEIDMSNVIALRTNFKEAFYNKHGVKLGVMSTFLKSSSVALKEMPVINAVIDDNEIVYRDFIDISVAIATSNGLVVPVIKNVGELSFSDIEIKLNDLTDRANKKQLSIDDLYGGTFTVSNGGVFGSLYGTPIINPPQSAILGMHAIIERPIAVNLKPVVRPMMYVALTYDHRLIDGREAVLFLKKIKSIVEEPIVMLLDL